MTISNSFILRLLSGLVLAPLTLAAIFYGGVAFQAFIAIAFGISFKEWVRMARKGGHTLRDGIIGVLYIGFCFTAILKLRLDFDQGLFLTMSLLLGVWASDIGAYFSGKFIGGPKLAVKISPNKTWAGFIGGLLGSAFALMALNHYALDLGALTGLELLPFAPLKQAFVIGAFFTIFGQIGDLMISRYKRKVGVKDTGNLIPGHGGILDRIDSLLLVTPFFLIVLQALGYA
jgi:phosphatidate cytidylyltransferase